VRDRRRPGRRTWAPSCLARIVVVEDNLRQTSISVLRRPVPWPVSLNPKKAVSGVQPI
jgi:hypothetical protein